MHSLDEPLERKNIKSKSIDDSPKISLDCKDKEKDISKIANKDQRKPIDINQGLQKVKSENVIGLQKKKYDNKIELNAIQIEKCKKQMTNITDNHYLSNVSLKKEIKENINRIFIAVHSTWGHAHILCLGGVQFFSVDG